MKSGIMGRIAHHRAAKASLAFLAVVFLCCFLGPLLLDPVTPDPQNLYAPWSLDHWLGTDDLGRDFLARLLHGGRISLLVAFLGAAASVLLGGCIGLLAGYYGGKLDTILMRFTESVMALPKLPLMILLTAVDLTKVLPWPEVATGSAASVLKLITIITLFGWLSAARLTRAATLDARNQEYIEAARAMGLPDLQIIKNHILPNVTAPIIVATTIDLGEIIIYESVLSFLGLGVQPPVPSWGAMLSKGLTYLHTAPTLMILPGLATFLTVAAFNFVGDGLRDALDPRSDRSAG